MISIALNGSPAARLGLVGRPVDWLAGANGGARNVVSMALNILTAHLSAPVLSATRPTAEQHQPQPSKGNQSEPSRADHETNRIPVCASVSSVACLHIASAAIAVWISAGRSATRSLAVGWPRATIRTLTKVQEKSIFLSGCWHKSVACPLMVDSQQQQQ